MVAEIILGADGQYLDANEAALDLLGLSLDALRALPRNALAATPPAEADALREEWERMGPEGAVGESSIRRADGSSLRVTFTLVAQPDGRWRATFRPVAGSVDRPTELYTIGHVLAAWRAAERRLSEVEAGSAEWAELQQRIDVLRGEHRRRFGEASG